MKHDDLDDKHYDLVRSNSNTSASNVRSLLCCKKNGSKIHNVKTRASRGRG